jgi:hypothetical protein
MAPSGLLLRRWQRAPARRSQMEGICWVLQQWQPHLRGHPLPGKQSSSTSTCGIMPFECEWLNVLFFQFISGPVAAVFSAVSQFTLTSVCQTWPVARYGHWTVMAVANLGSAVADSLPGRTKLNLQVVYGAAIATVGGLGAPT